MISKRYLHSPVCCIIHNVIVVLLLSNVWLFLTPWTAVHQAFLSITNYQSLLKLMSIESVMPSSHLILCCPLLLPPSIFPNIRVFSNDLALQIMWPKYWHFSFSVSPSNEYSGLISFRVDWFDLLALQGTLKSFIQLHSWMNIIQPWKRRKPAIGNSLDGLGESFVLGNKSDGGCGLVAKLCLTLCDHHGTVTHQGPCDFPDKNTGVGSHFLPQGIFLIQESNPQLLHCRYSLPLSHERSHNKSDRETQILYEITNVWHLKQLNSYRE